MTRFVVGDDRSQSALFPERLDDYLRDDNPVRTSLSMSLIWPSRALAALSQRRKAVLPSGDVVEELHLWIRQSGAIEPAPGAGVPAQHQVGLVDRPSDAGPQDN